VQGEKCKKLKGLQYNTWLALNFSPILALGYLVYWFYESKNKQEHPCFYKNLVYNIKGNILIYIAFYFEFS